MCDPEPIPADSPLLGMGNVVLTPHVASASVPAVSALRTQVAQTAARALRGEPLTNVVNGVKGMVSRDCAAERWEKRPLRVAANRGGKP